METSPLNAIWNPELDPGTEKGHDEKLENPNKVCNLVNLVI